MAAMAVTGSVRATAMAPARRRNDAPMTRLHISVGHAHKVSPGEMVGCHHR